MRSSSAWHAIINQSFKFSIAPGYFPPLANVAKNPLRSSSRNSEASMKRSVSTPFAVGFCCA